MTGGSESQLPFWLVANRHGILENEGEQGLLRVNPTISGGRIQHVKWDVGLEFLARSGQNQTVYFHQLFGQVEYGGFRLRIGRKEEYLGMVHPRMSIGSVTVSHNALPPVKLGVSLSDFVNVPGTNGFLAFRGSLSHGWMSGDRIVRDSFIHEKYLFLRFGKTESRIQFYAGLTHINNWGGTHVDPKVGDLPSGIGDFFRVFFAQPARSETVVQSEVTNVLGNALGSWDGRLDVRMPWGSVSAYRQFYLEDTLSILLRSFWDGIWGLNIALNDGPGGISGVLWESIYTKQQGSKSFERRGTDNYYNHVLYSSGWTHRGRAIGLPLATTQEGIGGVVNNMIVGHHFGVEGSVGGKVAYTALFTYSRNYGVHDIFEIETLSHFETELPLTRKDQYSLALFLEGPIWEEKNVSAFGRVAYDWGEFLPDQNFGATLGISFSSPN